MSLIMLNYRNNRFISRLKLAIWPKIIAPQHRDSLRDRCGLVTVTDRLREECESLGMPQIHPWIFMRVKNEGKTLLKSLQTILDISDRGVIGYNDCSDNSEDLIMSWCRTNPGYIPFKYDKKIIPAHSPKYANLHNLKEENTLAGYYNAVLSFIPKDEWILKVDGDHIHYPSILKHAMTLPRDQNEWVSFSRLNLVRVGREFRVISYVRPGDHYMIFNRGLNFVNVAGYRKNGTFFAHESLRKNGKGLGSLPPPWKPECSNIHLPYEKDYRACPFNTDKLRSVPIFFNNCDSSEFSSEFRNLVLKDLSDLLLS